MVQSELTISFESSFPSPLHYRLAKEFGRDFYHEFSAQIEDLRQRYGLAARSTSISPISDLEERVRQVTGLGALVVVLRNEFEVYQVGIKTRARIRRELHERGLKLEDITRAITFLDGFAQIKDYAAQTAERTVSVYTAYVEKAMEKAGSREEQAIRKAIKRKNFRHEVIRATHPGYEEAVDFYGSDVELTRKLLDFAREFRVAVPEVPTLQQLKIESRAPTQEVFDFVDGLMLIYRQALAKIYRVR